MQPLPVGPILVLARDPRVIAAVREAAAALSAAPPILLGSPTTALLWLIAPGEQAPRLVCEPAAAGAAWPDLLRAATDPFAPAALIVVQAERTGLPDGIVAVPPVAASLIAALSAAAPLRVAGEHADTAALRRGLESGEVEVRFQPIVSVDDLRPTGAEALARWRPTGLSRTIVPPDTFVPLAERAGLGRALTLLVLARALRDFAAPGRALPLFLAVNLPLPVLLRRDLPMLIEAALAEAGLPPERLVLEMTETSRVEDPTQLRRALERLRALGFKVWLDDWTLSDPRRRLLDLPFSGVKLDSRLVAALPRRRRARQEVERLVAAARRRGLLVTAEGVAQPTLWRAVAAAGVSHAQGFAIGRPMDGASLPVWVKVWRGARIGVWSRTGAPPPGPRGHRNPAHP